jgi:hypothetical protein
MMTTTTRTRLSRIRRRRNQTSQVSSPQPVKCEPVLHYIGRRAEKPKQRAAILLRLAGCGIGRRTRRIDFCYPRSGVSISRCGRNNQNRDDLFSHQNIIELLDSKSNITLRNHSDSFKISSPGLQRQTTHQTHHRQNTTLPASYSYT